MVRTVGATDPMPSIVLHDLADDLKAATIRNSAKVTMMSIVVFIADRY
jgi:hypothetical protein